MWVIEASRAQPTSGLRSKVIAFRCVSSRKYLQLHDGSRPQAENSKTVRLIRSE